MKLKLETNRLILRPFTIEDATDMYFNWASDPEVTKYVTWNPHKDISETKEILKRWIEEYNKPEKLRFAMVLKDSGDLIGGISVCGYEGGVDGIPIIGYASGKKYWNNGYMTEACQCLVDYLFSKGYERIKIDALVNNPGSNRVIQKCGGKLVCTEEDYLPLKDRKIEVNRYIIDNES